MFMMMSADCSKTSNSQVPNILVDITVYTTDPAFFKLNAIGGYVYITGGVKGIIIYHQGLDQYMAYDRDCPYLPNNTNSIVHVDSSGIIVVDTSCGSKFSLYDGSLLKGPASYGLKTYNTSVTGSAVRIYSQ